MKVLLELFQKARRLVMFSQKTHDEGTRARSNTPRSAVALRRGRNTPYPSKAPPKGEFSPKAKRGEPHKWGVPLIPQALFKSLIRFFFWQKKRKRKSLAKRKARERSFALASATNAPRVGSAVAFGKATQNLFKQTTPWRHR